MHAGCGASPAENARVIEPATQSPLRCPQCARTMDHLVLPSHGSAPLVVDHCPLCRMVWFDALESVQLSGLGWVRLLRELQRGPRDAPPPSRGSALGCPVCRLPLKPVQNQTRYGRFPALECPQHHGHLHGHAGALAERGLVRPLLAPERAALANSKRMLHCFNCGARADGLGERCGYCASPLMVIDLPRLAHALLRQPGDDSRSPLPDGVPLAWNCLGCGAALDPSRHASCPQCGQAALAPSLLDINPLLMAIETRLLRSEQAARPYRVKPKRGLHWQATGLGMLWRFWRADADEHTPGQGWGLWLIVGMFALWMMVFRR